MHSTFPVIIAAFSAVLQLASSSPVSANRPRAYLPFTGKTPLNERYTSAPWVPGSVLKPHEVLLIGEDRAEVVHHDVWKNVMQPSLYKTVFHDEEEHNSQSRIVGRSEHWDQKRDCPWVTTTIANYSQTFVDWDVQMSPAVRAVGNRTILSVTQGYSVADAISVGIGLDAKLIKEALGGASISIDYSRTWTTTYQAAISYEVNEGYTGVIITEPIVTRLYGYVNEGCVGKQSVKGNFEATSHEEGQQGGLRWIQGTITLCQKKLPTGLGPDMKEPKLPRCRGQGFFL